ncbi:glutamate formimidoyltransferase [Candidatus Woesebacteria bacterium GWC2_33_12]|uniref:glutamate formimidoyltransferase n=1 Tax=Candidatus Woesebacteria bacterium GW2011_GWB1_33_22 TaxID=1618566 RepID=A0A0G0A2A2_9BACT|nr:MAG: Glutamate formiminotransferase [Candidatus Woesebacteria bacterium GW2011_GWC2_33_12]KKP42568.1 MAG: Glutamate formiminotransferase [Candidatus Woesebacteria bacterium GW2011_GWA2_33_20]KKP45311.1 MAG: Glutamate formiminotransferase [Candidatus Woesebacteria bacterium GW2011_GWB1_33_22]KKP47139.1 MAG: Glutamate formiminotransferase [Microgenomates group bacterium GW2011_GWC1_33_28]KKP50981.1 MAG: Glutamate formiminotransferase [Candidatus Woesebacteria bacterium GW2011_GWA1_33_33]OGM07
MQKIVECVPNFSEGKNKKIINAIFDASLRQAQGKPVKVFELEYNASHNRMLFTIVGSPEDVLNSVFESIKVASKLIDMNSHVGEHPRIGAVDVVPFVPVSGVSMEECVKLSNKLAKKVADELKIPVFMYEASAKKEEYRNLADVRVGEYEGIKKVMRKPDYGPDKPHPTAGAVVIGARKYLVAYNVNLETNDVNIAKEIAKKIREKDGGLKAVKALGFEVDGMAQVSMNLVDFEITNFDKAYREIEKEAKNLGVGIKSSEIYGMIPLEALVKAIRTTFKGSTFKGDQVLEKRLWE